MLRNIVLIAYNNYAGGKQPLPPLDSSTQLPVLPETLSDDLPSEVEYVAEKSFISFGIMIAAIILLVFILVIVKRKKNDNLEKQKITAESTIKNEQTKQTEELEQNKQIELPLKSKKNRWLKLGTPANVQNCIKKFLEITK